jgi:glycosyltransferase involved in cell wall biosynthesis
MRRVLIVPDSIWGNDSGHRSTQFLTRTLKKQGFDIAVFAEDPPNFSSQRDNFLSSERVIFFPKTPYKFFDQFFPFKKSAIDEFKEILDKFEPDLVFYFGTIRNKITIDYLNSNDIKVPYVYLPLTNEFWCLKNFAGLKDGECYKCMGQNFTHAFINKCLETNNPLPYVKESIERMLSKKRFLNANALLGYSKSQRETYTMFGLDESKARHSNIFFDPKTIDGIKTSKGNYFLISGQLTDAKGWHLIPELLKLDLENKLKFKFVIYNKDLARKFVHKNKLEKFIENGKLEIITGLESHNDVLIQVANSLAVIIPSNYPSTGEFALLEAMGLGKPVVAFDVGAHKDFLADKENALISPTLDIEKMNKDLHLLYEDQVLWRKLSINSRSTFEEITNHDAMHSTIRTLTL